MAYGTRTVYPGKRNKELSSTFQPPEEGQSVQQPERCDKPGDNDEDNSLKNVSNALWEKYELCYSSSYGLHSITIFLLQGWL